MLTTPPGSSLRQLRERLAPAAFVPLMLLAAACMPLVFLASRTDEAPFRLTIESEVLSFVPERDLKLAIAVKQWTLRLVHNSKNGRVVTEYRSLGGDAANLLTIQSPPGTRLVFETLDPSIQAQDRQVSLLGKGTVSLQPSEDAAIERLNAKGDWEMANSGEVLTIDPLESDHVILGITPVAGDPRLAGPIPVSSISLTSRNPAGVIEAGLRSGSLFFLYKPTDEIKLFQGTDLRLETRRADLGGITLKGSHVEAGISGFASAVRIHGGTVSQPEQISLMPTRFDWLKNTPWAIVLSTVITFASGLIGAILAALQLIDLKVGRARP